MFKQRGAHHGVLTSCSPCKHATAENIRWNLSAVCFQEIRPMQHIVCHPPLKKTVYITLCFHIHWNPLWISLSSQGNCNYPNVCLNINIWFKKKISVQESIWYAYVWCIPKFTKWIPQLFEFIYVIWGWIKGTIRLYN